MNNFWKGIHVSLSYLFSESLFGRRIIQTHSFIVPIQVIHKIAMGISYKRKVRSFDLFHQLQFRLHWWFILFLLHCLKVLIIQIFDLYEIINCSLKQFHLSLIQWNTLNHRLLRHYLDSFLKPLNKEVDSKLMRCNDLFDVFEHLIDNGLDSFLDGWERFGLELYFFEEFCASQSLLNKVHINSINHFINGIRVGVDFLYYSYS